MTFLWSQLRLRLQLQLRLRLRLPAVVCTFSPLWLFNRFQIIHHTPPPLKNSARAEHGTEQDRAERSRKEPANERSREPANEQMSERARRGGAASLFVSANRTIYICFFFSPPPPHSILFYSFLFFFGRCCLVCWPACGCWPH